MPSLAGSVAKQVLRPKLKLESISSLAQSLPQRASPKDWVKHIKKTNYAVYRIPDGAEAASRAPSGYIILRHEGQPYFVKKSYAQGLAKQDNKRLRREP